MIELQNLKFAYPCQAPLLQNINATFAEKQITTILGPTAVEKVPCCNSPAAFCIRLREKFCCAARISII